MYHTVAWNIQPKSKEGLLLSKRRSSSAVVLSPLCEATELDKVSCSSEPTISARKSLLIPCSPSAARTPQILTSLGSDMKMRYRLPTVSKRIVVFLTWTSLGSPRCLECGSAVYFSKDV